MVCYLLFTTIVVCASIINAQFFDYYWRDYYGVVPEDALPGGEDINGAEVYIGQVYIHGYGLSIGQISPGKTEITVPFYGVKKQDYLIKILCTKHPENFCWFRTNADTYHVDTLGKHAVVGGYDHHNNKGVLHVGRVMHQGVLKFGNVASYDANVANFFFPDRAKEAMAKYYEVLIYNNDTQDIDSIPKNELDVKSLTV